MALEFDISESDAGDVAALEALYPQAFPDEDLLPVVRSLLQDPAIAVSLVAKVDMELAGHVIFTDCGVAGTDVHASLLAPLAVAPGKQRQGIGSALVQAGLRRLQQRDVSLVCVLGDPAYYGRLGFVAESLVEPPYPLPVEWQGAWQSQHLGDATQAVRGHFTIPPQWREPELWLP